MHNSSIKNSDRPYDRKKQVNFYLDYSLSYQNKNTVVCSQDCSRVQISPLLTTEPKNLKTKRLRSENPLITQDN